MWQYECHQYLKNPVMHSKTKHIPIKFHFLREQVTEKNIKLEYVATKEQVADVFTKPLPRETFEYLWENLGVILSPNWIDPSSTTHQHDRGRNNTTRSTFFHWFQRRRKFWTREVMEGCWNGEFCEQMNLFLRGIFVVVINNKGGYCWINCHWCQMVCQCVLGPLRVK